MAKCRQCGNSGLFLKVDGLGLCSYCVELNKSLARIHDLECKLEQATSDLAREQLRCIKLEDSITPDMQNAISLREAISKLNSQHEDLTHSILNARATLTDLQNQILVAEDIIEMESFSLYKPIYNFPVSDDYKAKLESVRDEQKLLIKNNQAAHCSTQWTVNGSRSAGQKQTNDNIKLFLRSFNNECDIAISGVKFNNFERCKQRIEKSCETINKLGTVNGISISPRYLQLKLAELHLAYEYALKKQEEKEEQAEIRRQQREQSKLDKEIAEARKAAVKDLQHYEQALTNIDELIILCEDPAQKDALIGKRSEIRDGLESVKSKLEDIDYRQTNQRAGYVYIISNIGAFGENVYKIGMTRRLNPMERVDELGDASVPFAFDVHALIFSADAPALESALHRAFDDRRINKVNTRREYFRVTLDEIKGVVKKNHDNSVEFIDVPKAEQYRQSIKM